MKITCSYICGLVADHFNIRPSDILSHRRTPPFVHPRQLTMYLCRAHTNLSYPALAKFFDRNHTTIIYAVERVSDNPKFIPDANALNAKIQQYREANYA